jgi:GcrA cell cycle regulator
MMTTWTDERYDLLGAMWAEGYTAQQIADKLGGVTRNGVIGKVHRSGLPARFTPPKKHCTTKTPAPKSKQKYVRQLIAPGGGKPLRMADVLVYELPVTVEDSEIPTRQRRTLLELRDHLCRYPVGDPKEPGFFFCGAPIQKGSPYCDGHHQRCYQEES